MSNEVERLTLRLPSPLYAQIEALAEAQGVSVNTFIERHLGSSIPIDVAASAPLPGIGEKL